ncbi:MAG: sensor histidine kinase [Sumerlaeia bacterium]
MKSPLKAPLFAQHEISIEPDYARWLVRIELQAILPLKLGLLAIALYYWLWRLDFLPPSGPVFLTFFLYAGFLLAEGYFFLRDRLGSRQAKHLIFTSYFLDVSFIITLIGLSLRDFALLPEGWFGELHLLFFLLIFRGFALFRSNKENAVVGVILSFLFWLTVAWYLQFMEKTPSPDEMLRLSMVWSLMLLTLFLVNLVSKQQAELVRVRERLVRIEGLAELGGLSAGVAHEINNPIGIIKAYADFLLKSTPQEDSRREDFETIRSEAERCEVIVRRMLDFSNPLGQKVEEIDLKLLLRETLAVVFDQRMVEQITVEFHSEAGLPTVQGDQVQLKQAFLNVLMNARQAVEANTQEKKIAVSIQQQKGPQSPLEVQVSDNGRGVSPEVCERAFDPFFTTRKEGTGLGLAITRRIIDAHQGNISLEPGHNCGTICRISIPIFEKN